MPPSSSKCQPSNVDPVNLRFLIREPGPTCNQTSSDILNHLLLSMLHKYSALNRSCYTCTEKILKKQTNWSTFSFPMNVLSASLFTMNWGCCHLPRCAGVQAAWSLSSRLEPVAEGKTLHTKRRTRPPPGTPVHCEHQSQVQSPPTVDTHQHREGGPVFRTDSLKNRQNKTALTEKAARPTKHTPVVTHDCKPVLLTFHDQCHYVMAAKCLIVARLRANLHTRLLWGQNVWRQQLK